MNISPDVEAAAEEVAAAVQALMSPTLPPAERQRTYELCERIKESPLALQCGLCLSADCRPDIVRQVGLQILENTIKFHWNDLPVEHKVVLKDATLELMASATDAAPAHTRDALCRPMVEIVKREWPQQYAQFVADMSRLAARGALHTELVLRVFLRLGEDVATFQTMEAATRRRDIYRGLVANMDTLFALLACTLTSCVSAGGHSPLAAVCLATLASYLEWAGVQHVVGGGGALLSLLLRLLTSPDLQQPAAECLAVLFARHGRLEDRQPLLLVFEPPAVTLLDEQVRRCCSQPPSDALLATLRLLAQALAGAVGQLTYCWGRPESTVGEPETWPAFVALLLRLTEVPAVGVAVSLLPAWTQLLRHGPASRSAPMLAAAPTLFDVLQRRARRPPDAAAAEQAWRQLEQDAGDEAALRPMLTECVRALAAAAPDATFTLLAEAVTRLVQAPEPADAAGRPQRADWETAVYLTEHVTPAVAARPDQTTRGGALLAACLQRRAADPQLQSLLVSLLSALSAFLPLLPHLTTPLLQRLLDAATFAAPPQPAGHAVLDLRRHGCNALLALAARRPAALAAEWPALLASVRPLLHAAPARPAVQDGVALSELLVLVHTRVGDHRQQSQLIGELVQPHLDSWRRLADVCRSPAALVTAVGLDAPAPAAAQLSADAGRHSTRQQLTHLVSLLCGLLQRCCPPADADQPADAFVDPATGAPRNPCAPHVLPQLPLVFQLVRSLSALEAPEQRRCLHADWAGALNLPAGRRQALLWGVAAAGSDDGPRSPLAKMQGFVTNLYETSHTLLALACTRLGQQVFDLPRLADYLAGSVLHELCHLPDHRLIVQVRGLWRCVVWRCPPDQRKSLLYPLLATLLDHLAERLDTRWQHLRQELTDGAERDGDDPEAVVAEQLTRQLTREAVQLVATVLFSKDPLPMADDAMDDDSPQTPAIRAVSPGGQAVLRSAVLARPLLTLLFRCIGWGDSPASLKATDMSPLVVRVLVDAKLVDDAAASQLLYWLLHGLEVQGHYDTNLNSLCTATTAVYLCLWPGHADAVDQVLCQIPEVNAELVAKLNQKMFNHPKISKSDKMKREEMKRLTRPLVSRSMSQLFQKKVSIRDLLPMATERRRPAAADITSIADLFGDT